MNEIEERSTAATAEPVLAVVACKLYPRHVDILRLCANGRTNAAIAGELGLSVHTVIGYWREMRRRLGVQSAPHAVAVALALGLIRVDEVTVPSPEGCATPSVAPESHTGLRGAPGAPGGPR